MVALRVLGSVVASGTWRGEGRYTPKVRGICHGREVGGLGPMATGHRRYSATAGCRRVVCSSGEVRFVGARCRVLSSNRCTYQPKIVFGYLVDGRFAVGGQQRGFLRVANRAFWQELVAVNRNPHAPYFPATL